MNATRNSKRNGKKSKHIKTDAFVIAIKEMAKSIRDFDPTSIITSFKDDRIRSSDFSLDGFKKRQEFVVEYCQNQKELKKVPAAKFIKLYQALNKKYRITGLCERVPSIPNIFNSGSLVFISPKYTTQIVENNLICSSESNTLDTPRRLYQYLNWTIRVNKINKYVNCFSTKNKENNVQFLLINSELHDQNGNVLYMFCIENDIRSEKAQKWQFVKLMTAAELIELVPDCALEKIITQFTMDDDDNHVSVCSVITSIISQFMGNYCDQDRVLPLGARKNGPQFDQLKQKKMITKVDISYGMTNTSYLQLKGIQTGYDKKRGNKQILRISLNAFENKIYEAAESDDPRHDLIPIVSILSGKKYGDGDYSVDQVLPVNIRDDEWIGICYRSGKPVMDLFDGYDITNKAILCDPTFNKTRLSFFNNNIYKIEITPRDHSYQPPTPSLSLSSCSYTPTPDTPQMQPEYDIDITPLAMDSVSSNGQDDDMQYQDPPDHDSSSCSSINQTQIYEQKVDQNQENEEKQYNYPNIANNDVQTDGMDTNTNMNMNVNNYRTNGLNGEGMMNNTNTMRNTNSIPLTNNGINNTTNTNINNQTTSTSMGFVNYVQNINGQYQFKPKNQPQQTMQQQPQIYINNFNNFNCQMLPTFPMMANFPLQNSFPAPTEGIQTTFQSLNVANLPPMTPQNTTFVPIPIYCYNYTNIPSIPCMNTLPNMQTPLLQQQFQLMMQTQAQMQPITPQAQTMGNYNVTLKASTPEFVPLIKQGKSSSIPKPASIEPSISTIREEI
mmetsp:Transcript_50451/g.45220  ORF Transcript_50451/g.45220 Transcript_50451/m.45220 type:complete len:782 (+) Transcript_50451:485-2830(+)